MPIISNWPPSAPHDTPCSRSHLAIIVSTKSPLLLVSNKSMGTQQSLCSLWASSQSSLWSLLTSPNRSFVNSSSWSSRPHLTVVIGFLITTSISPLAGSALETALWLWLPSLWRPLPVLPQLYPLLPLATQLPLVTFLPCN